MEYWIILPPGHILVWRFEKVWLMRYFSIFSSKFINIYQIYKLYQIVMLNWLKYFDKKKITQFSVPKCFNTPILYTNDAHFYNFSIKRGSISFSHLLTCKSPTIFKDATLLALILHLSFLSALRISNLISQAKSLIIVIVSGWSSSELVPSRLILLRSILKIPISVAENATLTESSKYRKISYWKRIFRNNTVTHFFGYILIRILIKYKKTSIDCLITHLLSHKAFENKFYCRRISIDRFITHFFNLIAFRNKF